MSEPLSDLLSAEPAPLSHGLDLPGLAELWWWDDAGPRSAAENMAVDECLLLANPPVPVLRSYGWSNRAITFGFGEASAPIRARFPGVEMTRRWTGGGVVEHGEDATYSLVLPRASTPDWRNSAAVYARVHEAVAEVLRARGLAAWRVDAGMQAIGSFCFDAPVRNDVLVGGRKVAGAGQRRTRDGVLHQGSLQGAAVLPGITRDLAAALAEKVSAFPAAWVPAPESVAALAESRYSLSSWIEAR